MRSWKIWFNSLSFEILDQLEKPNDNKQNVINEKPQPFWIFRQGLKRRGKLHVTKGLLCSGIKPGTSQPHDRRLQPEQPPTQGLMLGGEKVMWQRTRKKKKKCSSKWPWMITDCQLNTLWDSLSILAEERRVLNKEYKLVPVTQK